MKNKRILILSSVSFLRKVNKFIVIVIISLFIITGCFKPRKAEAPAQQVAAGWIAPLEYGQLIQNFKQSFEMKNVQNYLRCLSANEYRFIPAGRIQSGFPLIWNQWSLNDEKEYFQNMVTGLDINRSPVLNVTPTAVQFLGTDSIRYVATYSLKITFQDSLKPNEYKGQTEWILKLSPNREWTIATWSDVETVQDSSWTSLKLAFIQ